ncbi:ribonuclease HII, partial [Burkholderia mallei]|nr:ribonuclease HII [Burkholderia mallei]
MATTRKPRGGAGGATQPALDFDAPGEIVCGVDEA